MNKFDKPTDSISPDEVQRFCKNIEHIKLHRYRSLAEEYEPASVKTQEIGIFRLLFSFDLKKTYSTNFSLF